MGARTRHRILLAAVAAAIRIVAWIQLANGPAATAHLWDQSDMHFFHELAKRIVAGDVLLDGTYHPIEDTWRRNVAREYLARHPAVADTLSGRSQAEGTTPEKLLWDRWLGEKRYYQEPLYAYLVAGTLRVLGDDVRWVFAWQMLAGIGTVLLVHAAGARLFGERAGLAAGILVAGYSPLLFYEAVLLRATLLDFTGIALVVLLRTAADRDRLLVWLGTGLACGAALLLKTVFAPFALGGLAWIAVRNRRAPGRALRCAGVLLLGIAVPLAPVIARNVVVGAPPLALASPGLANPFTGLAPAPVRTGTSTHQLAGYGELIERSHGRLLPGLVATVRAHGSAGAFLQFLGRKVLHVWHWYEIPNNTNFYLGEAVAPILRWLPFRFLLLAPLALVGMVLAGRRLLSPGWPLTLAVATTLFTLVVFSHNSRLRTALVPALAPFAGLAVVDVADRIRRRRFRSAGAAVAAAALLAAWIARPLPAGQEVIRPADFAVAMQTFYRPRADAIAARGDARGAAELLQRALHLGPVWLRDPAVRKTPADDVRALARIWVAANEQCAELLEQAGRENDAASHRDVARRLAATYLEQAPAAPR